VLKVNGYVHCTVLLCVAAGAVAAQEPPRELDELLQLARASYAKGDYGTARDNLERAWALAEQTPREEPRRYEVLKQLFGVLSAAGRYADAEGYLQQAINWRENILGRDHPKVAEDLTELAMLCRRLGDYPRGLNIIQMVLSMHTRADGGFESPLVADDFSRMALLHMDEKQPEKAAGALQTAILIREKSLGTEHPALLPELDRLAATRVMLREYEKAEQVYRRALVIRERTIGPANPDLIPSVEGLAYSYFGQKKYAEAEPFYKRLLALWEIAGGKDHPMIALTLDKLSVFYREQERWEDAMEATVRASAIRALFFASGLSEEAYFRLSRGEKKEAERLYRRALAALDASRSEHNELRLQIEANLKQFVVPPRKPLPARKK
jgi:tetratricopeptide (TPR) repeat protein